MLLLIGLSGLALAVGVVVNQRSPRTAASLLDEGIQRPLQFGLSSADVRLDGVPAVRHRGGSVTERAVECVSRVWMLLRLWLVLLRASLGQILLAVVVRFKLFVRLGHSLDVELERDGITAW